MNYTPSASNSTITQNINSILLPIKNNNFTGISIANISISNNFLDITINAIIGPNSSISIIKQGMTPINYNGNVNTTLHLGSDFFNKMPFNFNQNINIVLNAAPNETIIINELSYKINIPINYKQILLIFLIVFFILNITLI